MRLLHFPLEQSVDQVHLMRVFKVFIIFISLLVVKLIKLNKKFKFWHHLACYIIIFYCYYFFHFQPNDWLYFINHLYFSYTIHYPNIILQYYHPYLIITILSLFQASYNVLYTYMIGQSRKNSLYFAKYIDFFQLQISVKLVSTRKYNNNTISKNS